MRLKALGADKVTVFGEAYGGSQQSMSHTYGKTLKFIVFDILIGDCWLAMPQMDECARELGFEVVYFEEGPTELVWIDVRDAPVGRRIRNATDSTNRKAKASVCGLPFEVTMTNSQRVPRLSCWATAPSERRRRKSSIRKSSRCSATRKPSPTNGSHYV